MKYFQIPSFILFSFLFITCGSEDADSDPNQEEETAEVSPEEKAPEQIEVYSVISDLNVRSTPGKDGVIIDKLAYGQRAIYLEEESDYKEKIIMRGTPRFSTWKKIRFSGSEGRGATDGWVFGGGIQTKEEVFIQKSDSIYTRNVDRITAEEASDLLGVEFTGEGFFKGFISYEKLDRPRIFRKNGAFELMPSLIDGENGKNMLSTRVSGTFSKGKPEGLFQKETQGYESSMFTTLLFEDGKCTLGSVKGNTEGEEVDFQVENPVECSFSFVEEKGF